MEKYGFSYWVDIFMLCIEIFFSRLFLLDRERFGLLVTLGQGVSAAQLKFKNEDMEHLACPSGHVPVSISTLNIERMMKLHRMWKAGAPAEISADRGRTAGTGPGTKRILASTHSNVSPWRVMDTQMDTTMWCPETVIVEQVCLSRLVEYILSKLMFYSWWGQAHLDRCEPNSIWGHNIQARPDSLRVRCDGPHVQVSWRGRQHIPQVCRPSQWIYESSGRFHNHLLAFSHLRY